jgi:superfamily II DNA or RNA helicase
MSYSLYPYQSDIIGQARVRIREGHKGILIQSPTGSGKTVLIAHMLKTAASRGHHCIFGVHRRELIKQSVRTFAESGVQVGVIAPGWKESATLPIQVASIPTLSRRLGKVRAPSLMVTDECHHSAAASWAKVHDAFSSAIRVGLTATPCRLDGKGLSKHYDTMVLGPSVRWLIDNGYLSPYRMFAPGGGVDLSGVHTRYGDYKRDEMLEAMDRPKITGDAVTHYLRLCAGRRAVAFCPSIEYSKELVRLLTAAGVAAEHVDGETPRDERDGAVERFASGITTVLSNVELFGEGFDLPAIEAAILLRPTKSLGLYLQQVGRALRVCQGKTDTIILDHVGNCKIHGLPDEDREWSLLGGAVASREDSGSPVRLCQKCFAALPAAVKECKHCGFVFPLQPRQIAQEEGDLTEVDRIALQKERRREQGRAETMDDLIAFGRKQGMKNPRGWAWHVMQARERRKVRG